LDMTAGLQSKVKDFSARSHENGTGFFHQAC
jgi:hypothetical protein